MLIFLLKIYKMSLVIMAVVQGFEPRLPGPKPGVLPLDDTTVLRYIICKKYLAAVQGFEPRSAGPDPAILPLDDTAENKKTSVNFCPPRFCNYLLIYLISGTQYTPLPQRNCITLLLLLIEIDISIF